MAEEVVGITIRVNGQDKVLTSMKEVRAALKQAQQDVLLFSEKFGATSEKAIDAAKQVARLKDAIGDAKSLTEAYNPDAKFKGFAQTLQGVVGGFAAVQGALGLVGVESGAVEKTLLKVQSAMAFSQGLNTVLESGEAFKNFSKQVGLTTAATKIYNFVMGQTAVQTTAVSTASKVAAIGMRVLRGVMASLGIGALIAGVTILISKISSWVGSTDSAKDANEKLNEAIDQQNKLFEKNRQALQNARQDAITEAKIKGASAEELFRINQTYGQKDIELTKSNAAEKLKTLQDFEKKNLEVVYENGQKRVRGDKDQIEQYKKLSKELEDANNTKNDAIRQSNVDAQNEQLRIADEGRARAKQATDKAKQLSEKQREEEKKLREEKLQAEKDAAQNILNLQDEIFLQSIKDETQRALVKLSQDKEKQINEINATKATAEQKAQQILLVEKKFQQDKDAIELDASEKRKEKEKADAEETIARLRQVIDIEKNIRIAGIQQEGERKRAQLEYEKEKEEEALAKQRADTYFSEEAYQQGLLNIKNKYIKAETDLKKEEADKQKKIEEEKNALTIDSINKIKDGFSNVVSEFGKNIDYQQQILKQNLDKGLISQEQFNAESEKLAKKKAKQERDLALFSLAIDTGVAIAGIVRLVSKNPMNLTGFAFAADLIARTGIVLTNMAKARNAINQAKLSSASSQSNMSGGTSGAGAAPPPMSPMLPVQATVTQLNQGSINQLGSATNRAYVVESDVTNSQERIKRINRAARLN